MVARKQKNLNYKSNKTQTRSIPIKKKLLEHVLLKMTKCLNFSDNLGQNTRRLFKSL